MLNTSQEITNQTLSWMLRCSSSSSVVTIDPERGERKTSQKYGGASTNGSSKTPKGRRNRFLFAIAFESCDSNVSARGRRLMV
jgi:hypothetical protein